MPHLSRFDVIREAARRWALVKAAASTSTAPLMLTYDDAEDASSESTDLTATLAELSSDEVKASLEAAGLDAGDDHEANVQRLAASMLHL